MWDTSASLVLTRPLINAPTLFGQAARPISDTGTEEASSRQERAPVGEPSSETVGDSLAPSMRGKRNVGRPEEFQVGAAKVQVTKETVQVGPEEVQVAEAEVQVVADGQGGQELGSVLAAGTQAMFEQAGGTWRVDEEEEGMEYESDSDCVSISDSQSLSGDLYTLEDINVFLKETFGQSVKVTDYFPDPEKFLKNALTLQKVVAVDILNERKHFYLKKTCDCSQEYAQESNREQNEKNSELEHGQ